MLGLSLLRLGRRRAGRGWLRRAGRRGDRDARLQFVASSVGSRQLNAFVGHTIFAFDAGELEVDGPEKARALFLELADHCRRRWLGQAEIECLQRAAELGSDEARVRLGSRYLDLGQPSEASRWFEKSSWARKIPDAESRELVFQLACGLHWAGDDAGSKRRLAVAAKAESARAIKILAGVQPVPSLRRRRRRLLLPASIHRLIGVIGRLGLGRYALGLIATAGIALGLAILGFAVWLFFTNLFGALHHATDGVVAIGFEVLALALVVPGAGVVVGSAGLYEIAFERRPPSAAVRR